MQRSDDTKPDSPDAVRDALGREAYAHFWRILATRDIRPIEDYDDLPAAHQEAWGAMAVHVRSITVPFPTKPTKP